jgi:hypothetical protein
MLAVFGIKKLDQALIEGVFLVVEDRIAESTKTAFIVVCTKQRVYGFIFQSKFAVSLDHDIEKPIENGHRLHLGPFLGFRDQLRRHAFRNFGFQVHAGLHSVGSDPVLVKRSYRKAHCLPIVVVGLHVMGSLEDTLARAIKLQRLPLVAAPW